MEGVKQQAAQAQRDDDDDSEQPTESWYSVLSAVASTLLLQGIFLKHDFQTQGRKKITYHTNMLRSLVMRVPTVWLDGQCRLFPIDEVTLPEWRQRFSKFASSVRRQDPTPHQVPFNLPTDVAQASLKKRAMEMIDGQDAGTTKDIRNAQQVNNTVSGETSNRLSLVNNRLGGMKPNLLSISEQEFLNASMFPPANVTEPAWDPFLVNMSQMNIYGQLELMYRRADQVQMACGFVRMEMDAHISDLAQEKQKLLEQAKSVREMHQVVHKIQQKSQRASEENHALADEIFEGMRHPTVNKYMSGRPNYLKVPSPTMLSSGYCTFACYLMF
jgi:hypothetical protein